MSISYITYIEPSRKRTGNLVDIYTREVGSDGYGKSHLFHKNIDLIIPSLEMPIDEAQQLLTQCKMDYPEIEFKTHYFDNKKQVIWAYVPNKSIFTRKENPLVLPEQFLVNKTSRSQQMRFYYSPFTLVSSEGENIILPRKEEKSQVDLETIVRDKKCSIDIELVDWTVPELERITNVILNFGVGHGGKGYIITSFQPNFKDYKGYEIISIGHLPLEERAAKFQEITAEIIQKEDPLILYGFNLPFDLKNLRDIGDSVFAPGVGNTKPVFKSVQGVVDRIETKGRFGIDLYGYLKLYRNIYKNNKLETHCQMSGIKFKKGLDYELLAHLTKLGEKGSLKDMMAVLDYVIGDGESTFDLGEDNIHKIISKAKFVGREPSVICSATGPAIMNEYLKKIFFLKNNTLRDRRQIGYRKEHFRLENYQKSLLDIYTPEKEQGKFVPKNGLFENVSIVFPTLFVKILWDTMLQGRTENLRFKTSEDRLDSYQTINEYVTHAVKDYLNLLKRAETNPDSWNFYSRLLYQEHGVNMNTIKTKIKMYADEFNQLLENAGFVNHSRRFLYLQDSDIIVNRGFGFLFGKGNCLSIDNKIVSLIDDKENPKMIFQGVGFSRGRKTMFDRYLMEEFLLRRLRLESEENLLSFLFEEVSDLKNGQVPKEQLVYPGFYRKLGNRVGPGFGFLDGSYEPIPTESFLSSEVPANHPLYLKNFLRAFIDILGVGFSKQKELVDIFTYT